MAAKLDQVRQEMLRFGVAVPEPHAASTSSHGRRNAASTQQQPQPKQQRSPQRGDEDDVDDVEATKAKLRDTVQRAQWHDPDAAWGGDPSSDTSVTRHGDRSDATTSGTDVGGSTTSGTRYSSGHGEARAMSMRLAGMSPPRRGWGAPTVHDSGPRRVVQPTMRLYTSAQPHGDDHGPKRRRHRRGSTSSSSGRARSRVAKGSKRRLASKGRRRQRQDEAVAVPSSLLVFGL